MKYKWGLLLLFCVVFARCNSFKDDTDYQASDIKGMATPIHLGPQFTEVVLSDYVMDPAAIDSLFIDVQHTWDKEKGTISIYNDYDRPYVDNLRLWINAKANDIPVIRGQNQQVNLIYRDRPGTEKVQVKGSFSSWALVDMQLQNGYWTTSLLLRPMIHEYVLVVNGEEMPDPENPDTKPNGMGGTNSILNIQQEVDKFPALRYDNHKGDQFSIISKTPDLNNVLVYYNNHLLPEQYVQYQNNEILIRIPKMPKKEKEAVKDLIRVFASNEYGKANELTIPVNNGRIVIKAEDLGRRDMHSNVLYFMMIDRFVDGDPTNTRKVENDSIADIANYFGGDLQGVLDKIEDGYFESLNINNIWLSPITQNPEGAYGFWPNPPSKFSGYHGYWPISNIKIDDRFGDDETLTKLIDAAHERGTNVILDYVANHVHEEHPVYQQHPDWATDLYLPDGSLNTQHWDDHRLTTWFDTFMPTLDFSKPEVVEQMTDSAMHWVTKFELDGFRHDATKHVPEAYWRSLTKKIKQQVDRPVYQIGETYGSYELIRSYVNTGMLDAQFDFNLYDAAVDAFANQESTFDNLTNKLQLALEYYGSNHLMGNISGNQDRARFISYASGDVRFDEDAKLAGWTRDIRLSDTTAYQNLLMLHVFNLSIPGIPVIYYGDEYGAIGANDPDNRRMMRFGEALSNNEKQTLEQVSNLVMLRRNCMALMYGTTEVLESTDDFLVLKRRYFKEEVYIFFNKSSSQKSFGVDEKLENIIYTYNTNPRFENGEVRLEVPAKSASIIVKNNQKNKI